MQSHTEDDCIQTYKEVKFQKKHRSVSYKVDKEKVVIDALGPREQKWGEFVNSLPKGEPRMCVFDLEYKSHDGMSCSRLFFCYWLPDGTPLKLKLPYATFKESFKTKLDIGGKQIVLSSVDEYTEQELIKEFDK